MYKFYKINIQEDPLIVNLKFSSWGTCFILETINNACVKWIRG